LLVVVTLEAQVDLVARVVGQAKVALFFLLHLAPASAGKVFLQRVATQQILLVIISSLPVVAVVVALPILARHRLQVELAVLFWQVHLTLATEYKSQVELVELLLAFKPRLARPQPIRLRQERAVVVAFL
jgi:hypothetical protein